MCPKNKKKKKKKTYEILGNNQESPCIETTLMSLMNVYFFQEKFFPTRLTIFLSVYQNMFEPYTFIRAFY